MIVVDSIHCENRGRNVLHPKMMMMMIVTISLDNNDHNYLSVYIYTYISFECININGKWSRNRCVNVTIVRGYKNNNNIMITVIMPVK